MAEEVLAARGLEFSYGDLRVLAGVDLTVRSGRFYGLVGPNGSGKTTLLDLLAGLRKPDRGEVLFRGRSIGQYPRRELARQIALAPQASAVDFPYTVREIVLMGRHPHLRRFAGPAGEDLDAADRAMEEIGIYGLRDKLVTELSGGEKQRVVLARVLAQDTPVLMLDEPTSSLDVKFALHALGVVAGLTRRGRTAVSVLHDLNLAAAFCDELIFLYAGRVHQAGPTGEVLTPESIARVFGVEARVGWDDFADARQVVFKKGATG
ncbi:MAG: ABC transporter ATP-binding protein [Thermodesulfobacteriota bacterium]